MDWGVVPRHREEISPSFSLFVGSSIDFLMMQRLLHVGMCNIVCLLC
jgi:hypothetical protein